MREADDLEVAARLSEGEPISEVFGDLRESFLTGEISAKKYVANCGTALLLFHVPYEHGLRGIPECQRLAEACITEMKKHGDLFEREDIKQAPIAKNSSKPVGSLLNFLADNFNRTFGSHLIDLHNDSQRETAMKFTLGVLLGHPDILDEALIKLESHADDPRFQHFEKLLGQAAAELKKERGGVLPQRPVSSAKQGRLFSAVYGA